MTRVRPLVTLGILALVLPVLAGSAAGTQQATVEECRTITEPGEYELDADLAADPERGAACLHVATSDVVIEGGGHAVTGGGGATGVRVAPPTFTATVENVTVRGVRVRNWATGVAVRGDAADVDLRDVSVANSSRGLVLVEVTDVTVRDARVRANDDGVITKDIARSTLRDLTLADNAGVGLRATNDFDDTLLADVTARDNGGDGIRVGPATNATVRNATVADNGEDGFVTLDTSRIRVRTLGTTGNDGTGLALTATDGARFENVTARDNGGNAYAARDSQNVSVAFSSLGTVPNVTITDGNAILDAADLPPTPRWLTPVGPAVRVTSVRDRSLRASPVTLTLPYTTDCQVSTASVWRHDGQVWQSVPESRSTGQRVTATVTEAGVFAPLALTFRDPGDCLSGAAG